MFLVPIYYTIIYDVSDPQAGLVFGSIGIIIGILALLGGTIIPILGSKKSLILSTFNTFLGFAILSMCSNFALSLFAVLGLISSGTALAWPVLGTCVKRYSTENSRSANNSIMMMGNYLGGIIAGTYVDIV